METIYLILDNIRSTHNVGSILRTADAAGVAHVFLCGVTPSPVDRFGRDRGDVAKVALGAEKSVPWSYEKETNEIILSLKEKGVVIVGVEQHKDSVPYNTLSYTRPVAFVLGEETKGLTKDTLGLCDLIVEIPMRGKKESLNVSVAAGIILFRCIE